MSLIFIVGLLGAVGLACVCYKKTMIGVLIGLQLMGMGIAGVFVLSGIYARAQEEGILFAFVLVLGAGIPLAGGVALAIRRYYLRKNVEMDDLGNLKQ